jgi:tape measure domain-containing protein
MAIGASQGNVIASAFVRIQPEISGFGPGLRQAMATNLLQLEKQSDGFFDKLKGSIGTASKLLVTASATSFSLVGGLAIHSASQLQVIQKSFEGLFGGVAEGKKQFDRVFQLAEVTPFEGGALAKNFQRFVAAFKLGGDDIGKASDRSIEILRTLADGGSALGASTENIDGFSLALSQTIGKGKLTGEEIRQFTNNLNGFNVAGQVATYMYGDSLPGSMAKFYAEMRKGNITSDIAIEGILKGLREIPGAAGASERQLRTMSGALSTVKDIFERSSFNGMGEALDIFANAAVDSSESLRAVFTTASEGIGDIMITGVDLGQRALRDFDSLFGKFVQGNISTYKYLLAGASDGLLESFKQFDRLGKLMIENQPYIFNIGQSLGKLSVAFSVFYTNVFEALEPAFRGGTVLLGLFADGFMAINDVINNTVLGAIREFGHEFFTTVLTVRDAFTNAFKGMGSTTDTFLTSLFGVAHGVENILSVPFKFIRESADDIAVAFRKLVETVGPSFTQLRGSLTILGEAFHNFLNAINLDSVSALFINTVKHIVEGFTAIGSFGAMATDILAGFLKILQPIIGTLGELPAQLLAAFSIFKLTGSPLLAFISMLKDFDTGLLVFFVTLTKVVPMINQFQKTLMALSATGTFTSLKQIGTTLVGIGVGKPAIEGTTQSLKGLLEQLKASGAITSKNARHLTNFFDRKGLLETNVALKENQATVLNSINGNKKLSRDLPGLEKGFAGIHTEVSRGTRLQAAWTQGMYQGKLAIAQAQDVQTKYNVGMKNAKINTDSVSSATNNASNGMSNYAKNSSKANVAMASGLQPASKMGGLLSSVGGIAASLGIGVGISLFTAHLANSAQKAAELKGKIDETKAAAVSFMTATSSEARQSGFEALVADLNNKMNGNDNSRKGFTNSLVANNLSPSDYVNLSLSSKKEDMDKIASVNKDALTKTLNIGKDLFEKQVKGPRNASDKVQTEGKKLLTDMANAGIDPTKFGRGLGINDKGMREALLKIAKSKGIKVGKDWDNSGIASSLGYDTFFNSGENFQFKGKLDKTREAVAAYATGLKDAKKEAADLNKQELANGKVLKENMTTYQAAAKGRTDAIKASGDYFKQLGEANTKENIAISSTAFAGFKGQNLTNTNFGYTDAGMKVASPLLGLTETESTLIGNTNQSIASAFDLMTKTNNEFDALAKKIGMSDTQVAQIRQNFGNLSIPEDFATFMNKLATENGGIIDPKQIKEAVKKMTDLKMTPEQQKVFLESIEIDSVRKEFEKAFKDVKANVIVGFSTEEATTAAGNLKDQVIDKKNYNTAFNPNSVKGAANLADFRSMSNDIFNQQAKINADFKSGVINSVKYQEEIAKVNKLYGESLNELNNNPILISRLRVQSGEATNYVAQAKLLVEGKTPVQAEAFYKEFFRQFGEPGSQDNFPLRFSVKFGVDGGAAGSASNTDLASVLDSEFKKSKNDNKKLNILIGIDPTQIATSINELGYDANAIKLKVLPEMDAEQRKAFLSSLYDLNPKVVVDLIYNNTLTADEIVTLIPKMSDEDLQKAIYKIPLKKFIDILPQLNDEDLKRTLAKSTDARLLKVFPKLDPEEFKRELSLLPEERLIALVPQMKPEQAAIALETVPQETFIKIISNMDDNALQASLALIPDQSFNKIFTDLDPAALERSVTLMSADQLAKVIPWLDQPTFNAVTAVMTSDQIKNIFPTLTPAGQAAFKAALEAINPALAGSLNLSKITGASSFIISDGTVTGRRTGNIRLYADGGLVHRATNAIIGEAGSEAVIPLTRPSRALQLMKQSGLYDLAMRNAGNSNYTSSSNQVYNTNNINVDARDINSQDPEATAMFLASRLTEGIRR